MKQVTLILIMALVGMSNCQFPYLFGSQVSTGGAARDKTDEKEATAAASTTLTTLDDTTSTKSQASGGGNSKASTEASGLWTNEIHGGSSSGEASNSEEGDAVTQSSSKNFQPYMDYYNQWYKAYIQYLNNINTALAANGGKASNMAGKKDFKGNKLIGQSGFDNHKSHASGQQSRVKSKSGTFTFNGTIISKGNTTGNANSGWAKSQSGANSLGYNNYVLAKNNSGAKGVGANSNSSTSLLNKEGSIYSESDSDASAAKGTSYSNIDASNHGFGAMSGKTDSETDGTSSTSKSSVRGTPFLK
jgi:hypothetical protein